MPYYSTLEEDIARAKAILEKGRHMPDQPVGFRGGGAIYPDDNFAAYELLVSFVAAIEAVGPKVCELALRHEQRANAVPDCLCRTRGCGHLASAHTGQQGACTVEGCDCGPGGWS